MKILISWFKSFPFFKSHSVVRGFIFSWMIVTFIIGLASTIFSLIVLLDISQPQNFSGNETAAVHLDKDLEEIQQMDFQMDTMETQLKSSEETIKEFTANFAPSGKCNTKPLPDSENSVQVVVSLEAGNANPREFIINKLDYVRGRCFTNQSPYKMTSYIPLGKDEKLLKFHTELFSEEDNIPAKLAIEVYDSKKELIGKYPSKNNEGTGTIKAYYPFRFAGNIILNRTQQVNPSVTSINSKR